MLDQIRIILVGTTHTGNIGSVARAMKTMGFSDLVLVNPRFADVLSQETTVAFASGAADVLARGEACCEQHRAGEGAGVGDAFDEGADGVGHGRAVHGQFDPQRVERVGVAVTIG